MQSIFHEHEIYRIDHFLGKETVQNILVLRFANEIFESLWNRNFIDAVEIRAAETIGVEGRGTYYESAGALRDMIQNHLMQLMGFVAMESPSSFDAELMRDEVAKVFRAFASIENGRCGEGTIYCRRDRRKSCGGLPGGKECFTRLYNRDLYWYAVFLSITGGGAELRFTSIPGNG